MADAWDIFPKVANSAPAGWDMFPAAKATEAPSELNFDAPVPEVRAAIEKLPETQRKAALRQWADQYVAKERAGGGAMQGVTDTVRNMARGTPVGSWLDEANAATSSAPYDETLEYQRATDRAIDKGATKIAGPITTADVAKVAGGIASVPISPVATVVRGATMLPQMANAALTGLGYGALYGAGQGENATERLTEGGKGAGIGFGVGGLAVPVVRGLGNAWSAGRDYFRGAPQALQQYDRGAVNRLSRAATDDDLAATYRQQVADLGPEGMLADMGPNLRGQAGALANQPGQGQRRVTQALNDRADDAAGRITQDVDNALGPPVNMPETLEATRQAYAQQAAPHRQQFRNNPVPFTQELDDVLQTLQYEPAVLREAARLANIDPAAGPRQFFARQMPDGTYQVTRAPNATEWDYIKRGLDGLAFGKTASRNDERVYGQLARRVNDAVDEAISPGAPQDSPWARARRLERENFQMQEGADEGRKVFDRGLTPDQLRAEMYGVGSPPRGGMDPPEAAAYGLGARESVRNIMGTAATRHGENAAAAARSKLGSDYAREKLDILAGPQAGGQLARRLDAETVFDQTRQAVTGNSATSGRLQAQKEFPNPTSSEDAIARRSASIPGLVMDGVHKIVNIVAGSAINERSARIAADAAEMLIAQGAARDQVAQGLMQYAQQRGISASHRNWINNVGMMVLSGGRQKSIESQKERR